MINWEYHFDNSNIRQDLAAKGERPVLYVEAKRKYADREVARLFGEEFPHRIYIGKLIKTPEEAELYFVQSLRFFVDQLDREVINLYRSAQKNGISMSQDMSDTISNLTEIISILGRVMGPNNALYGLWHLALDSPYTEADYWMSRYHALLFHNRYVHLAKAYNVPLTLAYWRAES